MDLVGTRLGEKYILQVLFKYSSVSSTLVLSSSLTEASSLLSSSEKLEAPTSFQVYVKDKCFVIEDIDLDIYFTKDLYSDIISKAKEKNIELPRFVGLKYHPPSKEVQGEHLVNDSDWIKMVEEWGSVSSSYIPICVVELLPSALQMMAAAVDSSFQNGHESTITSIEQWADNLLVTPGSPKVMPPNETDGAEEEDCSEDDDEGSQFDGDEEECSSSVDVSLDEESQTDEELDVDADTNNRMKLGHVEEDEDGSGSQLIVDKMAMVFNTGRASIEQNFHDLYLKFLNKVNSKALFKEVVQATYENCKVLLGSDLIKSSSEERSLLKNLGSWQGKITIGRNQVLRAKEIDLKSLIIDAYVKGLMIAVIPFTSKILEACQSSLAYQPPNPWTMGILGLLTEIYTMTNLKMNLKFDIEVLFKNLGVDLKNVVPTSLLKDRVREVEGNPDFSIKDVGHSSQRQVVTDAKPGIINTLNQVELPTEVNSSHPSGHSRIITQGLLQGQTPFSVSQLSAPSSNIEPQYIINP
ncbi:unnamed protein product [Cuscuta campestris]|uniref:CCR4-NOT transcription complex subunit 1 CAF1-binding domain-containing protein n=1 Tax=Cuscuta campestris TaxID=132261 RepID=A0A484MAS3_9ASTE|nr:unnamed protein product [Cuscuta campestris]